jgi:hypothetical protein
MDNTETQTTLGTQETVTINIRQVTVSCVPNVVCVSVLSIIDCHCFLCAQCCLCLCNVYYWLSLFPVSKHILASMMYFLNERYRKPSKWQSIIENTETQTTLGTQETVTINNRHYRDTDNIGHTGNSGNLSGSLYCLLLIVTVSCVSNVVCVSLLSNNSDNQ